MLNQFLLKLKKILYILIKILLQSEVQFFFLILLKKLHKIYFYQTYF
jgi:hypothetical protein